MTEKNIQSVTNWAVPNCSKEVEKVLCFVNDHRAFIKDFAKLAQPLYAITGKKKFIWEEEQQTSFEKLRRSVVEPQVLAIPNPSDPFILDVDASNWAIGGILSQVHNGRERVVAYGSFALTPEQKRYCLLVKSC